ncbi:MAG TPA: 2-oxo acid dehydrogenase subunit E2, partial [Rhizomicrobium sp.]|nr:2-oxo acid dehydrogenase subunit E2 [Rhizomicrobium sp.]
KVNAPIAVLLGEGEKPGDVDISAAMKNIGEAVKAEAPRPAPAKAEAPPAKVETPKAEAAPQAPKVPAASQTVHDGNRIFVSPLARRIAQQKGVDLGALSGSGPRGRIVKSDVESAKPGARPAAAPKGETGAPSLGMAVAPLPDARLFYKPGEYEEIPHDSMRKAIAKRLTSAKALIPHYYLTIDCNLTALMATRAKLNDAAGKNAAYKLSVNDFVIKAVAMALMKHPDVNASWTDNAILRHKHADVGVAVALDFGLITPIVFNAETKGLAEISNEVKLLAARAKEKKLKPQEYEGGGFSVSNLGMFGIKEFTAVINPPQAAILAVGAGEERAVIVDGKVEVATIMTVTMSCDHRVIDGATGARFLQTFKRFIEEPASMLL